MPEGSRPVPALTELSDFTHFVASRQGLFVVGPERAEMFASGSYFGITLRDGALFAFEHLDPADAPTLTGRIVRFEPGAARRAEVVVSALNNGCHQIDFIGDTLHIVDTYAQRLLGLRAEGELEIYYPLPAVTRDSGRPGYVHVNSITARSGLIYLLLHHGERQHSEIVALDGDYREVHRVTLDGHGCHNVVILEDGELLSCSSIAGALVSNRSLNVPIISGLMTRGLSVGREDLAVGSSVFGPRRRRKALPGIVTFLDRSYRNAAHVAVPGSPTDIRRIDGEDLSLANHNQVLRSIREQSVAERI